MPATFEATDEERTKFTNPEDLQQERLGVIPIGVTLKVSLD